MKPAREAPNPLDTKFTNTVAAIILGVYSLLNHRRANTEGLLIRNKLPMPAKVEPIKDHYG